MASMGRSGGAPRDFFGGLGYLDAGVGVRGDSCLGRREVCLWMPALCQAAGFSHLPRGSPIAAEAAALGTLPSPSSCCPLCPLSPVTQP